METDLHLQMSQHQASLKHENFTLSYHSYTTLLLQNILQLQLHFSCTLYNSGSQPGVPGPLGSETTFSGVRNAIFEGESLYVIVGYTCFKITKIYES